MNKCTVCGGNCEDIGGGKYVCDCCGARFSASDFVASRGSSSVAPKENSGVDVFESTIDGVLEIRWQEESGRYVITHSGSGFLISPDGYAITNTHVVTHEDGRSCGSVTVKIKDETLSASVITLGDNRHGNGNGVDLALIKLSRVPYGAKVMTFEDSSNVRIGQKVFVIGNSLGHGTCMTSGIVSDKARKVNGKTMLMTDCAINGGNSGGPIFNDKGLVIGAIVASALNSDGTDTEGMNYAIPSATVENFINSCNRGIRIQK